MPGPGRNQPCPCGSGRKTKHCCGQHRGPSEEQLAGVKDQPGRKNASSTRGDAARFARSAEGRSLIEGFMAIGDPLLRRHIAGLIKVLSQR